MYKLRAASPRLPTLLGILFLPEKNCHLKLLQDNFLAISYHVKVGKTADSMGKGFLEVEQPKGYKFLMLLRSLGCAIIFFKKSDEFTCSSNIKNSSSLLTWTIYPAESPGPACINGFTIKS